MKASNEQIELGKKAIEAYVKGIIADRGVEAGHVALEWDHAREHQMSFLKLTSGTRANTIGFWGRAIEDWTADPRVAEKYRLRIVLAIDDVSKE